MPTTSPLTISQLKMDWFSWLSKTTLEPSLVYEYGIAFSHNELEEEDIPYFNHEFLQSMGIAIAKHRLEILKLANKEKGGRRRISTLIFSIKKSLTHKIRALVPRREDRALVLVSGSARRNSTRWKRAKIDKRKKINGARRKEERLMMLTDGYDPLVPSTPKLECYSSPLVLDTQKVNGDEEEEEDGRHWTPALEEIRWDSMFQDLKPT